MKFKLEITMDNAAFDPEPGTEVADILDRTAARVIGLHLRPGHEYFLLDSNGNYTGQFSVVDS